MLYCWKIVWCPLGSGLKLTPKTFSALNYHTVVMNWNYKLTWLFEAHGLVSILFPHPVQKSKHVSKHPQVVHSVNARDHRALIELFLKQKGSYYSHKKLIFIEFLSYYYLILQQMQPSMSFLFNRFVPYYFDLHVKDDVNF